MNWSSDMPLIESDPFPCFWQQDSKVLKNKSVLSRKHKDATLSRENDLDWKEFAPRIEDYNHFLSKLIAGGIGQIVKGIFICSNAYTNKTKFWIQLKNKIFLPLPKLHPK